MKNKTQKIQPQNLQEMPLIKQLNLEQLDNLVGGSEVKIPGLHKVSDVTLKRG